MVCPYIRFNLEGVRITYLQVTRVLPWLPRCVIWLESYYPRTGYTYQHRGTLLEDSVQRSWTATFFRIFVFFLYPEKYGGSKTVLKSEIGLVDHIQKK